MLTGGTDIVSYELDWDNGLSQNVWNPLVGYASAFIGTSFTLTGVWSVVTYSFRLSA